MATPLYIYMYRCRREAALRGNHQAVQGVDWTVGGVETVGAAAVEASAGNGSGARMACI